MTKPPADLPRVIIVAEHASAQFGGESILPLHYFRFLRKRGVEAWLVVHERTRKELMQLIETADHERIHFVPNLRSQRALRAVGRRIPHRLAIMLTGQPMHLLTQLMQRRIVRDLVPRYKIDVVHEPAPVSPKAPSLMHSVGAPVVIGPMNGGMTFPPGFTYMESRVERWLIARGRSFSGFANRLIAGKRKAAALLVANERTALALPRTAATNVIELVENGVDLSLWRQLETRVADHEGVRFAYMGRLVDWKAIDLLLRAFARVRAEPGCPPVRLDLLGDGPDRAALERLTDELELGDVVTFHGFLPQHECATLLAEFDVLMLPSLYECGGAVVLEAMAMSKPVIASAWGGPADYLDDSCGILVPPEDKESFIDALSVAMRRMADDDEARARMGRAGREKIEREYDWQIKIDQILEIYRGVIDDSTNGSRAKTAPA